MIPIKFVTANLIYKSTEMENKQSVTEPETLREKLNEEQQEESDFEEQR